MITIVSSTNREGSNSLKLAKVYASLLAAKGIESNVLDLRKLPANFLESDLFGKRSPEVKDIIEKYIAPVSQFVFILPEYHGGFPGIAKVFLDAVESAYFFNKKAALVGVSSGRAGNLRGMDAFGNVLNYLQVEVLSDKVKISAIEKIMNSDDTITDEETLYRLNKQIDKLLMHHKAIV